MEIYTLKFNKMIPELTVFDIEESKKFYVDILGFKIEYERINEKFVFLTFEGSQFMLEQLHDDGWNIGELSYPLGKGINFSIQVENIDAYYKKLLNHNIRFYRNLMISRYQVDNEIIEKKEFLVQDPNGYLLRFTN